MLCRRREPLHQHSWQAVSAYQYIDTSYGHPQPTTIVTLKCTGCGRLNQTFLAGYQHLHELQEQ